MNKTALHCLLCGAAQVGIRRFLSSEDILKCWAIDGHRFSTEAIRNLLDEPAVHLYTCWQCGFEFFNPELAGGAKFYEELEAGGPGYYADNRPENERNVRFALRRGYRNLLDVGCGSGFALDAARRAGLQTFGLELSTTAAAEGARRGHTIFPVLLESLDPMWEGKFDLITLNQLLEHVPDPAGLIRQCVRFLSPRGAIAVAVPGANGILRFTPWLESNWPPHHVSRWKKKDFATLAQRTGLRVLETGGDQLLGSVIRQILLGHRQRCCVLGKPYHGLPPVCINVLSFIYRKLGLKYFCPLHGPSIYCYMARR